MRVVSYSIPLWNLCLPHSISQKQNRKSIGTRLPTFTLPMTTWFLNLVNHKLMEIAMNKICYTVRRILVLLAVLVLLTGWLQKVVTVVDKINFFP